MEISVFDLKDCFLIWDFSFSIISLFSAFWLTFYLESVILLIHKFLPGFVMCHFICSGLTWSEPKQRRLDK